MITNKHKKIMMFFFVFIGSLFILATIHSESDQPKNFCGKFNCSNISCPEICDNFCDKTDYFQYFVVENIEEKDVCDGREGISLNGGEIRFNKISGDIKFNPEYLKKMFGEDTEEEISLDPSDTEVEISGNNVILNIVEESLWEESHKFIRIIPKQVGSSLEINGKRCNNMQPKSEDSYILVNIYTGEVEKMQDVKIGEFENKSFGECNLGGYGGFNIPEGGEISLSKDGVLNLPEGTELNGAFVEKTRLGDIKIRGESIKLPNGHVLDKGILKIKGDSEGAEYFVPSGRRSFVDKIGIGSSNKGSTKLLFDKRNNGYGKSVFLGEEDVVVNCHSDYQQRKSIENGDELYPCPTIFANEEYNGLGFSDYNHETEEYSELKNTKVSVRPRAKSHCPLCGPGGNMDKTADYNEQIQIKKGSPNSEKIEETMPIINVKKRAVVNEPEYEERREHYPNTFGSANIKVEDSEGDGSAYEIRGGELFGLEEIHIDREPEKTTRGWDTNFIGGGDYDGRSAPFIVQQSDALLNKGIVENPSRRYLTEQGKSGKEIETIYKPTKTQHDSGTIKGLINNYMYGTSKGYSISSK